MSTPAIELKNITKTFGNQVMVSTSYLCPGERILIIDDFLANGEALRGLVDLCRQAGAKCVGYGAVIEKEWQGGHKRLEDLGYDVESLAIVTSINDDDIKFK